jgi:hypothetical protein
MKTIKVYLIKEEWEKAQPPNPRMSASIFSTLKKRYPSEHCICLEITEIAIRVNNVCLTMTPHEITSTFLLNQKLLSSNSENKVSTVLKRIKAFLLTLLPK